MSRKFNFAFGEIETLILSFESNERRGNDFKAYFFYTSTIDGVKRYCSLNFLHFVRDDFGWARGEERGATNGRVYVKLQLP